MEPNDAGNKISGILFVISTGFGAAILWYMYLKAHSDTQDIQHGILPQHRVAGHCIFVLVHVGATALVFCLAFYRIRDLLNRISAEMFCIVKRNV